MKRPDEVKLSPEEGAALIERLEHDTWTIDDRRVVVQVLRWYFWLLFALQETKLSLKRLRTLLCGQPAKKHNAPPPGASSVARDPDGGGGCAASEAGVAKAEGDQRLGRSGGHRPGQGRLGAQAYMGAERVVCRHAELAVGERCPVCGLGRLYTVPPGVEMRLDGTALLQAVRYEVEKLRCSACGQIFTASLPESAGTEKYRPRARAVLAVGRYDLGVPSYRLEGYQAMVGVPVPDATQGEQIERVADCAYPVFVSLESLAAQGEVIYQDDTPVRILSLIAENRHAATEANGSSGAHERTGMYTTGLVGKVGEQTICLSSAGRSHAGENLLALLTQRDVARGKPLVMSDALSSNAAEEQALIRCHCLAHGRRKFAERADVCPAECAAVLDALKHVFAHEEAARSQQMSAEERVASHPYSSGPILAGLKSWLEQQCAARTVEPNRSLGKAFSYLLGHGPTVTQFLRVPGAPMDHNTVERALKLAIRQRKNSFFYATEHGASIASMLTSLIATCLQAGVNALEYLVALQEHRPAVFGNPAAWLPWNYQEQLVPPERSGFQSSAIAACCGLPFHRRIGHSRADRRTWAPSEEGHQVKRPCDRRLLHSQKP